MTRSTHNDRVERAKSLLKSYRKRSLFFSDGPIFDDPAWELLLETYIATEQSDYISIKKLNDRISAPNSIICRWIGVFADRDYLVVRKSQGEDCVQLTDRARGRCFAYLTETSGS